MKRTVSPVVLLLFLALVAPFSSGAGEMPEWEWAKLVLVYEGKDYVVEMLDRDPAKDLYLTTPFPGYPACDGKCLTVLRPNGQIVKVVRMKEREKWREASNWGSYQYATSGRYVVPKFPVAVGDKASYTFRWPGRDGREIDYTIELTVLGKETIQIAAGMIEVFKIEDVIRAGTWSATRYLYFDPKVNLAVKWVGGSSPWEMKEYTPWKP